MTRADRVVTRPSTSMASGKWRRRRLWLELLETRRVLAGNGPPNVLAITRLDANPTSQSQVAYRVLFDEAVQASTVDTSDFALTRGGSLAGGNVLNVSGTGDTYTVQVNTGSGSGSLRLDLIDDNTIRDLSGDRLGGNGPGNGNFTSGEAYAIDRSPPTALTLNRNSSNPTSSTTAEYLLSFNESVVGVGASDFDLVTSGITGANIVSVVGSGTAYTITVGTGNGEGTLQLRLLDDDSIRDTANNPLGGSGLGNGTLLGQTFSIQRAPFVVSSIPLDFTYTNASTVRFAVQFSENVFGVDVNDFETLTSGSVTGTSVTNVTGSGANYVVSLDTGTGDGGLFLRKAATATITNASGTALSDTWPGGQGYGLDRTRPLVESVLLLDANPSNQSQVRFAVTFSEAVTNVAVNDFALVTSGLSGIALTNLTNVNNVVWHVSANTGTGNGTLSLDVLSANLILDSAGNSLSTPSTNNPAYTLDRVAPTLLSITRSDATPTNAAAVSYNLTFSEPVVGLTAAAFSVQANGLAGATIQSFVGGGSTYTVTLATGTGQGTLALGYNFTVADQAGNTLAQSGTASAYNVDRVFPTVVSIVPQVPGPTSNSDIHFVVTFSEIVSGVDLNDLELQALGAASGSIVAISSTNNVDYSVRVSTGPGDGELRLRLIDNDSITDGVNNPLGGTGVNNGDFTPNSGTLIKKSIDIVGIAWQDNNADGSIDSNEPRLAGIRVYIDLNQNNNWDSGSEPSQLTGSAGDYAFTNLSPGPTIVSVVLPADTQQTFPASGGPGRLTWRFAPSVFDGQTRSGAIASNNRFVIAGNSRSLDAYPFDPNTGLLGNRQSLTVNSGLSEIELSADDRFLYQTNLDWSSLSVFAVNQTTGAVTAINTFTNNSGGVTGLGSARSVEISPDGQNVVVVGQGLAQFARDTATGGLTFLRSIASSATFMDVRFSPDNNYLYIADIAGRLLVYRIDPITKALSLHQTIVGNIGGVPPLNNLFSLAVSTDGNHIYGCSAANNSIIHFVRQSNGTLSFANGTTTGQNGIELLDGVASIELSRDGKQLYAVGGSRYALVVLQRDVTTGQLTLGDNFREGSGTAYTTLSDLRDVIVSADGRFVLAPAMVDSALNIFENGFGFPQPFPRSVTMLAGGTATVHFGMANLPPDALSLSPLGANPTSQSTAAFAVQFSEPVTGVDVNDFAIIATGITGATITSVSGSGANYTLTVTNISGNGSLTVALNDNDTIVDSTGLTLRGTGTASSIFSSSPILVIDQTPPQVATFVANTPAVTRAASASFQLTFSENVSGVDATDFEIVTTGTISGAAISSVSNFGGVTTITVTTGTGNGSLSLRLVDNDSIVDTVNLPLGGAGLGNGSSLSTSGYTLENTAESSISGQAYADLNNNGLRDASEPALSNWTVFLDNNGNRQFDVGEQSSVTGADGSYVINGLFSGQYNVSAVIPAGWEQTSPGTASYPIKRISVSANGVEDFASSDAPSLSADGRFIAFESSASLVNGDTSTSDIFVFDRIANSLSKITTGIGGVLADGGSFAPAISNDGRMVAFYSSATNLVAGDTNGLNDIFVYNRQTQVMTLVSRGPGGVLGNAGSDVGLDISGDGRFVTFQSTASNLVVGDLNGVADIFVVDLENSNLETRTQLVSKSTAGVSGNSASTRPMISDDGSLIVYESTATNLVSGDTNGQSDIFLTSRIPAATRRLSQSATGSQANSSSQGAAISGDGNFAGFWSNATNLATVDSNGAPDVFVVDLNSNAVELVSRTVSGQSAGGVGRPSLSSNGRYVAFTSSSSLLTNSGVMDVFVRDRVDPLTNPLRRVSQTQYGSASGGNSHFFGLSDDGRFAAFGSDAKHLISGDNNYARDTFLVDLSYRWLPNTRNVVIGVSQSFSNVSFGHRALVGEVTGVSWQDTSRNGQRDPGEPANVGRQVYVDTNSNSIWEAGEAITTTDTLGGFRLSPIPTGEQRIREILPANWTGTSPSNSTYVRTLGARSLILNFEEFAAITSAQTIGVYARDGFLLSTTNAAANQWRIDVPSGSNTAELVSTTTGTGQHLMRQDYRAFTVSSLSVRTITSTSVSFVGEQQNGNTLTQSVSIAAGKSNINLTGFTNLRSLRWSTPVSIFLDNIALQTTENDYSGLDFGSMSLPGQILGYLYYDDDKDGVRDPAEVPILGRQIYIDADNDGVMDVDESRVSSDAVGNFAFSSINAGTYTLRQSLPTGWNQTQPVSSYALTIEPNQVVSSVAFGSWGTAGNIQGTKWHDTNADGVRASTEPGLPGWTIYLDLNNNSTLDVGEPSTVTLSDNPSTTSVDEAGTYQFNNLRPLPYVVREVPQPGWVQTSPVAVQNNLKHRANSGITAPSFQHHPAQDNFVSGTGRYEVFTSSLALLPQDTNNVIDVYLYDRESNSLELISFALNGAAASGHSLEPSVSDDGRYVAFRSFANTLTASSVNPNIVNVYVRDRLTNTTRLISEGVGSPANDYSYEPIISADGRTLVFWSWASNLVADDTDLLPDFFIKDLVGGGLTRVEATQISPTMPISETWGGDVSGNGRFVTFQAVSQGIGHIFWMDRTTAQIQLVSTSSTGVLGNSQSEKRNLSDDGRFVVFDSSSSNLTDDIGVSGFNVFLKDMVSGETRLISRNYNGGAANGSRRPDISRDGRWIVFESTSQTMFADSSNSPSQIVLYDRLTNSLTRVTGSGGVKGNAPSVNASISSDGQTISFQSTATNLGAVGSGLFTISRSIDATAPQPISLSLAAATTFDLADIGDARADASISGTIFNDIDRDGERDPTEAALSNTTVFIDSNKNTVRDPGEPVAISGSNGAYGFNNLLPGSYTVRAELPGNRVATGPGTTQNRLFGVAGGGSTVIVELNPQTGAIVRTINPLLQGTTLAGAAFDGTNVLLLNQGLNAILKVSPSGATTRMPISFNYLTGLAYQNGLAYFIATINSWPHLIAFDVNAGQAVRTLPLTHSLDGYGAAAFPALGAGLGEAPDGDGLIVTAADATSSDGRLLRIDTGTGRIKQYVSPATSVPDDFGATAVGGELFVSTLSSIRVFNSQLQFVRALPASQTYYGMASGTAIDFGQTVQIASSQNIASLDFGQRTTSSSVSGHLYEDRNGNQQPDVGESDLAGVTVYLDSNSNFRFDVGELSALTDSSGRYTLSNVPTGHRTVRVVPPPGLNVSSPANTETRLFGTRIAGGVGSLLELDPITGAIKNQLTSPVGVNIALGAGLAFDGNDLFFVESNTKRIYALNPDNGNVRRSYQLTGAGYDGLAVVNGKLYVQDSVSNTILELDVGLTTVLRTLDVNQLNPNYLGVGLTIDLNGGLGENADGTRLILQTANNSASYLLNPISGVIEGQWQNRPFAGLAGAGGEVFSSLFGGSFLDVFNSQGEMVRRGNLVAESTVALAAATINSRGAQIVVVVGQDVSPLDFALRDNSTPTSITFSSTTVAENLPAGSVVSDLTSIDANPNDLHQYQLVVGAGDSDNGLFEIVGSQLRTRQAFDFENRSNFSIRVRSTDATGNAFETTKLISVINLPEVVNVQIGDGSSQRSTIQQVVIELEGQLDIDADAFLIQKRERDNQGALALQTVTSTPVVTLLPSGNTRVILTFSGAYVRVQLAPPLLGALVDGNYQLTIDASKIRAAGTQLQLDGDRNGVGGGNYSLGTQAADNFFAFYGDSDGNRSVGVADFGRFRSSFGKALGDLGYDAAFDYDENGAVGVSDFGQFRSRFGKVLEF